MTEKKLYENILVELNTVKAPSLHLEDYNYWANKGVQEYINERYNLYQTTQQLTDDLQALNSHVSASINTANTIATYSGSSTETSNITLGNKYNSGYLQVSFPTNYMHLLNCITDISTSINVKCDPAGYVHSAPAKRLTSDIAGGIINNAFLKPGYRTPYYSVVDDIQNNIKEGAIQLFYGNPNRFAMNGFTIDYLKQPAIINLTIAQRDAIVDNSTILEFPEYVCNELIKRIVKLILENQQNPRLETQIPVNQSIN